jgi:hypothetical protein
MNSVVEVRVPNYTSITVHVTLLPSLTVLDLKMLIVNEMATSGHGGGAADSIRLIRKHVELYDHVRLVDIPLEEHDSVIVSMCLIPPQPHEAVVVAEGDRNSIHHDDKSVGSIAMSKASADADDKDRGSATGASFTNDQKSTGNNDDPSHHDHDHDHEHEHMEEKMAAAAKAHHANKYPAVPTFQSQLYEYADFLGDVTPGNGSTQIALDSRLTLQFHANKSNGMVPCVEAIENLGPWQSMVGLLPSKTRAAAVLSAEMNAHSDTLATVRKAERDEANKKKQPGLIDPYNPVKEPSLAEQNATIEALAAQEAARKVAEAATRGHHGDMEAYYDRNHEELTRRGYVKWKHPPAEDPPGGILLLKASPELGNNHNKHGAGGPAKHFNQRGSVSIAQTTLQNLDRTGMAPTLGGGGGGGGDRHRMDVELDKVRYWWRGVNGGYAHGDRHSWQRYTLEPPVPCKVEMKKVGGLEVDIHAAARDNTRNRIVDRLLAQTQREATAGGKATGTSGNGSVKTVSSPLSLAAWEEEEKTGKECEGQRQYVNVPCIADLSQRLPSRNQLDVDSFPKLKIMEHGEAHGLKSRESYPLQWGDASSNEEEEEEESHKMNFSDRKGVMRYAPDDPDHAECFADAQMTTYELTLTPAAPLEPRTDYLLVLRNGLPVVPIGGTHARLTAYHSAGVMCEDRIFRFRTETKSSYIAKVKADNAAAVEKAKLLQLQEEGESTSDELAALARVQRLKKKNLRQVNFSSLKARISDGLTAKAGTREYVTTAQTLCREYDQSVVDRYADGTLSEQIEATLDRDNPSHLQQKFDSVVVP